MLIYGINPVLEALRARTCPPAAGRRRARDRRLEEPSALAREQRGGGRAGRCARRSIARPRGGVHQGWSPSWTPPRDYSVAEIVEAAAPAAPLIVVLDGIEDPHNVGAILRTADARRRHGVVRQARHAASLDGVAGKLRPGPSRTCGLRRS